MTVKSVATSLLTAATLAGAAHAETRVQAIARHLAEQGYHDIEVSRTFLGRARIEAEKDGIEREIIVNPRSGEILRDYWEEDDDHKVLGHGSEKSEKNGTLPNASSSQEGAPPDNSPGGGGDKASTGGKEASGRNNENRGNADRGNDKDDD